MEFRLLGSMDVIDGDAAIALGGPKQRALLARLLLDANRTVAVDRLVDDVWGEAAPETAPKMVQIYVSQLRKVLPEGTLVTRPPGYLVELDPESVDVVRFDRLRRLGRASLEAGEPDTAAAQLREALALWRGEALAEFREPFAESERNRLEELWLSCTEDRVEADLQRGAHADLTGELTTLTERFPLRERLRSQAMLAFYRAGRQADALAVYRDFRRTLSDELGLDPSPALRELEHWILSDDPALAPASPAPATGHASSLESAAGALRRGDWDEAMEAFAAAGDAPEALEGLAHAARFGSHGARGLDAGTRAFRGYRARDDRRSAARIAAWLAYDVAVFRGDTAVAQGWFGHAHRLLDGLDEGEERGWLAFLEGEVLLLTHGDPALAGEHARLARDVARRAGAVDLEMLALSLIGLARVADGDIDDGMRELDQATAAAVAGEISALHLAGTVCCHMIYACERVQDVARAAQWCDTLHGYCVQANVPELFGFCRSHYASVLIWRGEWAEAEAELEAAAGLFEQGAPAMVHESTLRLAELRRRQGRAEEAAELCERSGWHPGAQLCLAAIALQRGDLPGARDLLARHLRTLPAGERVARAPARELGVRIHLATGDLPAAQDDLAELEAIAATGGTAPLRASVSYCRGLVARAGGDPATARRELEDAIDLWSRLGAPYELSLGRIALAELALEAGRGDEAAGQLRQARRALDGLAAVVELERAETLLIGLEAT